MSRIFQLAASVLLATVGMIVLSTADAQAGTCLTFCSKQMRDVVVDGRAVPDYISVVAVNGPSCSPPAQACPIVSTATCPDGFAPATGDQPAEFCRLVTPLLNEGGQPNEYHQFAQGTWCTSLLSTDRLPADGSCYLTADELAERRRATNTLTGRITVGPTPVPTPANPGEGFRCRYLCQGETATRDGQACSADTDQAACIRQCASACGSMARCSGVLTTGTVDNDSADQAPQCIPAQASTSVGGLVDSGRFESVNESFTNISVPNFIGNLIKAMLGISGALFFAMLVWGGVRWMTSSGDPAAVQAAQKITQNAVVGVILIILAYTVVSAFMQIVVQVTSPAS